MPILGLAPGRATDPIVSRALRIGLSALLRSAIPFGNAFALASLLASLSGKRSFLLQSWPGPLTWSYAHQPTTQRIISATGPQSSLIDVKNALKGLRLECLRSF